MESTYISWVIESMKLFYFASALLAIASVFFFRSKTLFAVIWILVMVLTVVVLNFALLGSSYTAIVIGVILGIMTFIMSSKGVTVPVPEQTAYLGFNIFTGEPFLLLTGLKPRWPWEKVDETNKFVLSPEPVSAKKQGETRDGGIFNIDVTVWYVPDVSDVKALVAYNNLGDTETAKKKVAENITARIGSAVIRALKTRTLMDVLESATPLQTTIEQELRGSGKTEIEIKFGIAIDQVVVGDITPDENTGKVTRLTAKGTSYMTQIQYMMKNIPGLTTEAAIDIVLQGDPDAKRYGFTGKHPIFAGFGAGTVTHHDVGGNNG